MIVFLPYENYHRDLLGRLLLAHEILKQKKVNSVHIGWHKDIFWKLFENYFIKRKNYQSILIDSNSFNYKYPIIKFLNFFQFKYYVLDEEEIGLIFLKKKKFVTFRSPNRKFSNLIQNRFVFNSKIKKIYSKFSLKENIVVSGNPRIELYKKISNSHIARKSRVCVMMPIPYFRLKNFLSLKNEKSRPDRVKKKIKIKIDYLKKFVQNINLLIKKNKNIEFLIRPHPSDIEYISKYKKIFCNSKNVLIRQKGFAFNEIVKSKELICGLDFAPIEGILLNKHPKVFLGGILSDDKSFRDHFSYNIKGIKYFKNRINLNLKTKSKIELQSELIKNFSINLKSSEIISNSINYNFKKKNIIKNIFFNFLIFLFMKPLKFLKQIRKKPYNKVTIKDYKNYCKLLENNFFLRVINKFYDKVFYSLYKTFLFYKFDEHSAYRMSGQQQKIILKDFKQVLNILDKNKVYKFNINKTKTNLTLTKN